MRFRIHVAFFLALLISLPGTVLAQNYPDKTIKIIVPYPPGGVVDITGRLLASELGRELGGNIVVVNKPGASGTIGAAFVAEAEPDGYTVLLSGAATHAFAPWLFKSLRYDAVKSFAPVTQVTEGPLALCVNSSSPIKNLDEFIKMLKKDSDAVTFSSSGNGTYPHLSVELLKQSLNVKPVHVAYQGGGKSITALLGNEVQFSQNHIPIVLPHVKSKRLRCLATTGETRSATFPDLPTLKESGIDVTASAWFGLFVPAGTPPDIIDRIYKATAAATKSATLKERLAAQGDAVLVEGPNQFKEFQVLELEKWKKVIGNSGLTLK